MKSTKILIVILIVLFGSLGMMESEVYAYSKMENEVFKEMDILSRSIPQGLMEQEIERSGTSEGYSYSDSECSAINGRNLRMVRYRRSVAAGRNLGVVCLKIDDDIIKKHREGRLNLRMRILFALKPDLSSTLQITRSSDEHDDGESFILTKGYDIVKYIQKNRNAPWKRYEGKFNIEKFDSGIEHSSEGEEVPTGQVQRYIDLAERFDETYSFPKGEPDQIWGMLAKGPDKQEKRELRAYYGSMAKYVERALKENPELINARIDGWKQTPLHLIAYNGQKEVADILITNGADVNSKDKHGYTPLHRAVEKGHKDIAELLIANWADVNAKDKYGNTPLHRAVEKELTDITELLITKGADINAKTNSGCTPLHFVIFRTVMDSRSTQKTIELFRKHGASMGSDIYDAVVQGNIDKTKTLLSNDRNLVNSKDGDWRMTPLHWAIICGQEEVANLLITKGADVKAEHIIIGDATGGIAVGGFTPLHWAVYRGWKDVAELLIAKGADVNTVLIGEIRVGRTPLFCALEKGYDDIAKLLVVNGAELTILDRGGHTPLSVAIHNDRYDVIDFLKKHGAAVMIPGSALHYAWSGGGEGSGRRLEKAVCSGNIDKVKEILTENPELVNAEAKNTSQLYPSRTPLYDAITNRKVDMAKLLIDKGANVNAKLQGSNTYLFRAIYSNQKEIVELLIENGADVDVYNSTFGDTGLSWAISHGQKDIIELLIENGVDINAKTRDGETPLHWAMRSRSPNKELAMLLVNKGADVNAKDDDGKTLLHCAADIGWYEMSKLLIEKGVQVDAKYKIKRNRSYGGWYSGYTALHFASHKGHKDVVELLVGKGAEIHAQGKNGNTPLDCSLMACKKETAQFLIDKGANVNLRYDLPGSYLSDSSAIHMAAKNGCIDVVEILIANGANVNAKNSYENVPMHYAKTKEIAKILIENGAELNLKNKNGKTPLHNAVGNSSKEMVELLISKEADLNDKDGRGNTSMDIVVKKWDIGIGNLLMKHGGLMSNDIFNAIMQGNVKMVSSLLSEKPEEVNIKHNTNLCCLDVAVFFDQKEVIEILISKGASITSTGKNGMTLLHKAAEENQENVAAVLVAKGLDINAKDNWGWTPLFRAAYNGHKNIAKLLIANGGQVNIKDNYGQTALFYAAGYHHREIYELLRKHGGKMNHEIYDAVVRGDFAVTKSWLTTNPELVTIKDSAWEWTLLFWAIYYGHEDIAELLIAKEADVNVKDTLGQTPLHKAVSIGHKELVELLILNKVFVNARDSKHITPLKLALEKNNKEIIDLLKKHGAVE